MMESYIPIELPLWIKWTLYLLPAIGYIAMRSYVNAPLAIILADIMVIAWGVFGFIPTWAVATYVIAFPLLSLGQAAVVDNRRTSQETAMPPETDVEDLIEEAPVIDMDKPPKY